MNYLIKFKDKKEINVEMTDEIYNAFKNQLRDKTCKVIEINGNLYNPSSINSVEKQVVMPLAPGYVIAKTEAQQRRLLGGVDKGFQKIDTRGYMSKMFDSMKKLGHFKNYSTYTDWCKDHEKEAITQS